jgi:NADH-quinone oxidoreductase subunit D
VPYFDRLDYVSPMNQEHAYRARGREAARHPGAERGQYIRVLFSEITRILNHILNVTTFAMDVGALTPPLWGFEQRELLMEYYEGVSARACTRPTSGPAASPGPAGRHARFDGWLDQAVLPVPQGHREAAERQPHLPPAHRSISAS